MTEEYSLVDATMKVIQDRRSIRDYTDEPVSDQDLDMILESARLAPSGENALPWRFVIVKDEGKRKRIGALAGGGSGRRFTAEFVTQKMQERFASLQDEEKKKAAFQKLTSGNVSTFLANAPVNIVVCGRKDVWDLPYDTSAAIENMLLVATALDLGACWVIAPCIDIRDEERIKALLGPGNPSPPRRSPASPRPARASPSAATACSWAPRCGAAPATCSSCAPAPRRPTARSRGLRLRPPETEFERGIRQYGTC